MDDAADQVEPQHHQESTLTRLAVFLRSVIPADPWQLTFLAGLVCLTVSPSLAWWRIPNQDVAARIDRIYQQAQHQWHMYFMVGAGLIAAGAASGFAACLWPGKRQVRRILLTVCLPAILGMAAILGRNFYLKNASKSFFEQGTWSVTKVHPALVMAWGFGSGVHFCVFGLCS
jgi:hypothetical protein